VHWCAELLWERTCARQAYGAIHPSVTRRAQVRSHRKTQTLRRAPTPHPGGEREQRCALVCRTTVGAHPVRDKPTERYIPAWRSRTGCAPTESAHVPASTRPTPRRGEGDVMCIGVQNYCGSALVRDKPTERDIPAWLVAHKCAPTESVRALGSPLTSAAMTVKKSTVRIIPSHRAPFITCRSHTPLRDTPSDPVRCTGSRRSTASCRWSCRWAGACWRCC